MDIASLLSVVTIAFLGSFGHCIGMCGGIAIAYSSTKIDPTTSRNMQAISHLLYSFGRVTTYTVLGAVFGLAGGVATFSNNTNGILLLVAGVTMVLAGFSLLGKIKFLTIIEHSVSKSKWYQSMFSQLLDTKSLFSFYLLGLLNGLLPCGFVYFFAITAASTGSVYWGALVMFIFGLSTIPAMFSISFFVGFFKSGSFRNTMLKIASIAVIAFGIYTLYRGYYFIFDPNASILDCHT
jgi:sulfite exporter TauE/SafE